MKGLKRIVLNVLYVSLGVLLGLAWNVRPREVRLGVDGVPPTAEAASLSLLNRNPSAKPAQKVTVTLEPKDIIVARPAQPNGVVFVYYPGGRVPPQSYEFMARALASWGVTVAIPAMPLELAVIAPNRASEVRQLLESNGLKITKFVVGGHSLGGAMAARYAAGNPVDGLVLMGSFSADNLSGKSFAVLNLAAEFDGLATLEKIRDRLNQLPAGTTVTVIPGGVHSYFGRYGPQDGDGQPTVSRDPFERELIGHLETFFSKLEASP